MPMTLKECVAAAAAKRTAIGHFNASTLDGVWAIADAARELSLPIIIGVSEGERDYLGVRQIAAVVESIREERGQDIFLNADHSYSFDRVKEAVDAGFDSVIYDGAALSIEENIEATKKCVAYAKTRKSLSGAGILIEGELGYIGTSSKLLDEIPAGAAVAKANMTQPLEAARFVRETGVDMLAPAIGNVHGIIRGGDPALDTERAAEIALAAGVPLVLHGASGNTPEDVERAVKSGIAVVHVNTELRVAYRSGLLRSLTEDPDEVAPYKFLKPAKIAMQKKVEEKLKILNGL